MASIKDKIEKENESIAKYEEQIAELRKKIKKANSNIENYQVQWLSEITKGMSISEIEEKLSAEKDKTVNIQS